MVYIIMLAAGFSRRFQGNKLLCSVLGKPLYLWTLDELLLLSKKSKEKTELIVVTQYQEILEECKKRNVIAVLNQENNTGIASSIKLGIQKVQMLKDLQQSEKECHLLFSVSDQPHLKWQEIDQMLTQFLVSKKEIASMGYIENKIQKICNPVIFHDKYIEELLQLKEEEGGKHVLQRHMDQVFIYNTENHLFFKDIDQKSDLKLEEFL